MAVIFASYIEGTNVTDMTDILNTFLAILAVFLEIIQYFVTAITDISQNITNVWKKRVVYITASL